MVTLLEILEENDPRRSDNVYVRLAAHTEDAKTQMKKLQTAMIVSNYYAAGIVDPKSAVVIGGSYA